MIQNNNGRIVRKIALRSLKSGILRNTFVIITIAMTAALISGLAGFSAGNKKEEERELSFMPHGIYADLSDEQLESLRSDGRLDEILAYKCGSYLEAEGYMLRAGYYQKDTGRIKTPASAISAGHYPEKINEVVVDKAYMECIGREPELGADITVTWLDGTVESYVVSGYTDEKLSAKVFTLLFSEEYAKNGSQLKKIPFSASVRICNAEAMSRDEFLSEIRTIGEEYGIPRANIDENNQFVINKTFTFKEGLGIGLVSAVILFASVLVIYSIFYISITGRLRQFGQLRTIGMTSKQIRKAVNIEGAALSCAGIAIGLLLGTFFACVLKPGGFYFPHTLVICLFTAALILVTVMFSIRKPAKLAAFVPPVEAAKMSGYETEKHTFSGKTKRKLTPFGLSKISVGRNQKKFRMTVLSLGIGGILFLCGTTLLSSYNREEYSRQLDFYFGEYVIKISSNAKQLAEHGMTDIQMQNPLNEEMKSHIASLEGVKNITVIESMELTYEYNHYRGDDCAAPFDREETELLNRHREDGAEFNYDKMVQDKEIIISNNDVAEEIFGRGFQTGDMVLLRWFDGEKYQEDYFKIAGSIDTLGVYEDKDDRGRRMEMGAGWFLIPRELLETMMPPNSSLNSEFIISVENWQKDTKVREALDTIISENTALSCGTLAEEIKQDENAYQTLAYTIYGLSAFIMGFALINLINTLVSNVMSRKHEFAMLRSIGMSARQLSQMVIGEGMMLAVRNMMVSFLLGTAAGYALIVIMNNLGANYMHWHLPIRYMLGYAVLVMVVPVVISKVVIKVLDKKTLVERLRDSSL